MDFTSVFSHRSDSLSFKGGLDIKNSHDPSLNRSGYPGGPREMSWNLRSSAMASGGFFWGRAGPKKVREKV